MRGRPYTKTRLLNLVLVWRRHRQLKHRLKMPLTIFTEVLIIDIHRRELLVQSIDTLTSNDFPIISSTYEVGKQA